MTTRAGAGTEPSGASPVLVGALIAGQAGQGIAWTLWPVEVYRAGAVLRTRLTPTGPWKEYPGPRELVETLNPPAAGNHHHQIVVAGPAGPMRWVASQLPTAGVEPGPNDDPWDHSWTVEWWWPREQWLAPARLVWPERDLEIELPVDPAALETAAATRPPPPSVATEDHRAELDHPVHGLPVVETHRWPHTDHN